MGNMLYLDELGNGFSVGTYGFKSVRDNCLKDMMRFHFPHPGMNSRVFLATQPEHLAEVQEVISLEGFCPIEMKPFKRHISSRI
jgi:hypothetical protein